MSEEKSVLERLDNTIHSMAARLERGVNQYSDPDVISQAALLQNFEKVVNLRVILAEIYEETEREPPIPVRSEDGEAE